MGNDYSCSIEGIGSIKFKMWDYSYRTLENVRVVPDLRRNLISLGMLDSNGDSYKSENGVLKVLRRSMVILKGILKKGLYVLQVEAILGNAVALSSVKDETKIWHRRLGHIGIKGLHELAKQGILDPNKIGNLEFCEICVLGKSYRL